MIMDFFIGIIEKFLGFANSLIDKMLDFLNIDIYIQKFNFLINLIKKVNFILPIKELLDVISIVCGIAFLLLSYWIIQKIYTMIRG